MSEHLLIQEWRSFAPTQPPYVLASEKDHLPSERTVTFASFEDYVASTEFGDRSDVAFHTGLLPVPFVGSLNRATIFVLMINPGLAPGDYFQEYHFPWFRERLLRTIHQQNEGDRYPFMGLDPSLAWHTGFGYWHAKFRDIAHALVRQRAMTYQSALAELAQSVAVLELVPYHSRSFRAHSLIGKLPSSQLMLDYVHAELVPRARKREVLILVTRTARHWKLSDDDGIVVYRGPETRRAHLSLNSRGGQAIAQWLGISL